MAGQLSKRARMVRQARSVLSFALVCALLTALQVLFAPHGPAPWWWPPAWITWFNADRNGCIVALLTAAICAAGLGIGLFQVFQSVALPEAEERIKTTVIEQAAEIKAVAEQTHAGVEAVRETTGLFDAKLDLILAGLGLSKSQLDKVLTAFDRSLQGLDLSPADAEQKLIELAQQYVQRVNAAERPTNDRPEIAAKRLEAAAALREGEFGRAEALFGEIAARHLEAGKTEVLSAAAALMEQGGAARLRNDLLTAAGHFHHAAEIAAPFDAELASDAHWNEGDALYYHGRLFPGLDPLRRSAAVWRSLAASAADEKRRASSQTNLGNALAALGERATGAEGIEALNQAVAAYRAALTVHTESEMPADWAMTQSNLGATLETLGTRAGGAEGIEALNTAVAAYRAALTVRTEAETPADWAITQNNLGNALGSLGDRTEGAEGIEILSQAVAAFRAALTVHTKAKMQANWGATQNNLGNALGSLGGRIEGAEGVEALSQAVAAYRAALTVRTETAMPANWAMTQNNLGLALANLGKRTAGAEGIEALNQAVAAHRAALTIYTEAEMPAHWALTSENLALANTSLAEINDDLERLDDAIALMDRALPAFEAMQAAYYVEKANRNRARMVALRERLSGRS